MCLTKVTHKWFNLPTTVTAFKVFRIVLEDDPLITYARKDTGISLDVGDLLPMLYHNTERALPRGSWLTASTKHNWRRSHWVNENFYHATGKWWERLFGHAYKVGWHAFKEERAADAYIGKMSFSSRHEIVLPVRLRSLTAIGTYDNIMTNPLVAYVARELYIPTLAELPNLEEIT